MNQEIKSRWLAKLKSGEYTQGRTYLCANNQHCCLGVLTEMAIEDGLPVTKLRNQDDYGPVRAPYGVDMFLSKTADGNTEKQTVWLPKTLQDWAEISEADCGLLSSANDSYCNGKYTAVIPLIEEL